MVHKQAYLCYSELCDNTMFQTSTIIATQNNTAIWRCNSVHVSGLPVIIRLKKSIVQRALKNDSLVSTPVVAAVQSPFLAARPLASSSLSELSTLELLVLRFFHLDAGPSGRVLSSLLHPPLPNSLCWRSRRILCRLEGQRGGGC